MTDSEVEQRLGYTPCVCGVIDGTWHPKCYLAMPPENIQDAYKRAFAKARRYLKRQMLASLKTPNAVSAEMVRE